MPFVFFGEDNTLIVQLFCVSQTCHTKEGEHYAFIMKDFRVLVLGGVLV